MNREKQILITGGSGFIAGYLARALHKEGYSVTLLDVTAPDPGLSAFPFIFQDVNQKDSFTQVLTHSWHAIFHFAAIVSVPICEQHPEKSFQTNFESVQTLLQFFAGQGRVPPLPFIFFASSAAVYGDLCRDGVRLSEAQTLPNPRSFYGLHKYASEQSLRMYCETKGLRGLSFRFFNVYGPGQKSDSPYSGVISKFTHALAMNENITLFNSGRNVRDFIHVEDIASACINALTLSREELNGESLNLCTGQGIRIQTVLEMMSSSAQKNVFPSKVTMAGPRAGDIEFSCGDPSHAEKKLRWKAQSFRF